MRIHCLPRLLGAATAAFCLGGCASITRGTSESLLIQSEPSGATVRLSSGGTGFTPISFKVPRKGDVVVEVSLEGYETIQVTSKAQISGAGTAGFLGNVLIGGLIGGAVDAGTGATLSHTPNPVSVVLKKKAAAPPTGLAPAENLKAATPATSPDSKQTP